MLKISLNGYSAGDQMELQSRVIQLVVGCNGTMIDERMVSPAACRLDFEVPLGEIVELYAGLHREDLQLTPRSHQALTQMGVCRKYLPAGRADLEVVLVDLHLNTLEEEQVQFRRFVRVDPV